MDAITIGSIVVVGHRYVMSDTAPHVGRGHMEGDAFTGQTYRVVVLRPGVASLGSVPSAGLAPANLSDATEEDEVVDIALRRLTLAP